MVADIDATPLLNYLDSLPSRARYPGSIERIIYRIRHEQQGMTTLGALDRTLVALGLGHCLHEWWDDDMNPTVTSFKGAPNVALNTLPPSVGRKKRNFPT